MPAVSEQFKTYHDFASASLQDIYGERLDAAQQFVCNSMQSGVWINQQSSFFWLPLPWQAQLSPINAIASGDFDADGKIELILAQNHFSNWIETGLWRGTPGTHLEWNGSHFQTLTFPQSGIFLPNDTKAIITLPNTQSTHILAAQNQGPLLLFSSQPSNKQ
ncbi:hypothetical protein [Rubritalea tangerina]|uniref:VCBS repeat-containing protein n=1 Tax=Rubritalea tangerina TaxID=430798 RepID=A0ABW4ZF47_9BACT